MAVDPIAFEQWLEGRSEVVRELARKYPPGTCFRIHGQLMYAIAYNDSGRLSVTPTDPAENYEEALAQRVPICECCLEQLERDATTS